MAEQIRWGILGLGKIAHKFAQAVVSMPETALGAVGSRSLDRAQTFAAQYGTSRAFGSYEELADDPEIDAIYIATPHHLHFTCIKLCIEREKPVLCEKPFTINAREAREAVELARRRNVFLMEAMWTRFLPVIRTAVDWIRAGEIGDVRMMSASFGYKTNSSNERMFDPAMGGGALLNLGVYMVSLASLVFQEAPNDIAGFAELSASGVDEESGIVLKHSGGRFANLSCSMRTRFPNDALIVGSEGYLRLEHFSKADAILRTHGNEEQRFAFPYQCGGFEHEIAEVGRCLKEGRRESAIMPLDETVTIMETMDRIRNVWGMRYPMD